MIKIITDSAADYAQNNNKDILEIVPLTIQIDGKTYKDGVDLKAKEFYDLLESSDSFPKTSQPSPQEFVNIFNKIKEDGDTAIVITLSSKASGTFQSATIAKDIVEYDKIFIVDSCHISLGQRILVDLAIKLAKLGKDVSEIVDSVKNTIGKIRYMSMIDDLSYLLKGGRIKKSEALFASLADIKPMIEVRDGEVKIYHKTFGKVRAMKYLVKQYLDYNINENFKKYFAFTTTKENLLKFAEKAKIKIENAVVIQFGPTVGSHLGKAGFLCCVVEN